MQIDIAHMKRTQTPLRTPLHSGVGTNIICPFATLCIRRQTINRYIDRLAEPDQPKLKQNNNPQFLKINIICAIQTATKIGASISSNMGAYPYKYLHTRTYAEYASLSHIVVLGANKR